MINESEIKDKIASIKRGNEVWKKIYHEYNLSGKDIAVFFPESQNETLNSKVISFLYLLKKYRNPTQMVLIYGKEVKGVNGVPDYCRTYQIEENEVIDLLNCFADYNFGFNFLVASFRLPYGRNADRIVDRHKISIDEIILNGVLGLSREETESFDFDTDN